MERIDRINTAIRLGDPVVPPVGTVFVPNDSRASSSDIITVKEWDEQDDLLYVESNFVKQLIDWMNDEYKEELAQECAQYRDVCVQRKKVLREWHIGSIPDDAPPFEKWVRVR